MPGSMPFHLEKGVTFSVIEDFAQKAGWQALLKYRNSLRAGAPAADVALDSSNLDGAGPTPTYDDRVRHVNEDWFGWHQDANGQWVPQQPSDFNPWTHPETGYWHNYFGDVEKIWRTTLIRACEVILGIGHNQDWPDNQPTPRCWPVSFFWRCPNPWFETWITWQRYGTGPKDGTVVVNVHSPGHASPVLTSPLSPPNRSGPRFPEYVEEPRTADGTYGMWITTHRDHDRHICALPVRDPEIAKERPKATFPHEGTVLGKILGPHFGPVYEGVGAVVTVQPCEADGGVLPQGRPY